MVLNEIEGGGGAAADDDVLVALAEVAVFEGFDKMV